MTVDGGKVSSRLPEMEGKGAGHCIIMMVVLIMTTTDPPRQLVETAFFYSHLYVSPSLQILSELSFENEANFSAATSALSLR